MDLIQSEVDAILQGQDIGPRRENTGELDLSRFQGEVAAPTPLAPPKREFCVGNEFSEDISRYLDPVAVDALGEIGNICMGTSATTMSSLLGRRVVITTPTVQLFKSRNVLSAFHCPFLVVSVNYIEGIFGHNLLILNDEAAAVITNLMMGGEGLVDASDMVIDELQLSAIGEVMNQMIGSSATAMSNMMGVPVNISPPYAEKLEVDEDVTKYLDGSELVIRISFDMEIDGVLKTKLMQMMPLELATDLLKAQMVPFAPVTPVAPPPPPPPPPPAPAPKPAPKVEVKPAVCPSFDQPTACSDSFEDNLRLISDIPLQVTIELGKTHRSLQEVMNLGNGSIVMLDRLAGEPVDIIVNGKAIAKGEVVVIEENYGARITEMLTPSGLASQ